MYGENGRVDPDRAPERKRVPDRRRRIDDAEPQLLIADVAV
jgi:hypothetical protein